MLQKIADRAGSVSASGVLLLAISLSGCAEKGPPTFPVQGKLVFERGGKIFPLYDSQGGILFESVDQPGVQAYGAINEDGSFKLTTAIDGVAKEGAVAGTYRGRLILDESVQKLVAPEFLDLQKSGFKITVPADGEIVMKIWR
jgi:hypothetical protein